MESHTTEFLDLCPDNIQTVFGFLDLKSTTRMAQVSKEMRVAINSVWENRYRREVVKYAGKYTTKMGMLYRAVKHNSLALVKKLVKLGANVNRHYMRHGRVDRCLAIAVRHNYVEMVRLLLICGASPSLGDEDYKPLHIAAIHGYHDIAELLLLAKARVNEAVRPSRAEHYRYAPLHLAAEYGHIHTLRVLLDFSADVNLKGFDGSTALHCAAENGHPEVVETLLKHGADPNALDDYGDTPLIPAVCSLSVDTVRHLMDFGANINVSSKERCGSTVLHLAVETNRADLVYTLLRGHSPIEGINAKNDHQETPFCIAAHNLKGDPRILKRLLDAGADRKTVSVYAGSCRYHT